VFSSNYATPKEELLMKKWILVIASCLLLQAIYVYGQVDSRMVVISHTRGALGTQSSLVVSIELNTNYAYNIYKYKITFNIGAGLNALRDAEPTYDHYKFNTAHYSKAATRSSANITFEYNYTGSTPVTLTVDSWDEVARATITYTETAGRYTTFSWDGYSVSWNLPPPIPCDGTTDPMPDYLVDLSLPVEMSRMTAEYTYEQGAIINWTTQSELNTEAFMVYRSEADGSGLELVSNEMIPGQGISSSAFNYQIIDPNVSWNSSYQYFIKEVTSDQKAIDVYYGPINLQTGKAPKDFVLHNNFPNPFNPSTMITYEILEGGMVDLSIYNLLGQKVKTLVNEIKPAGIYPVAWSGVDDRGKIVPTGVYLYKITAPEGSEVRKMMKVE
jgi:hypothetical protein